MKKLLIYCSFTGNGEKVAKEFESHNFEVRKVEEKHKMSKSFFFAVLGGGFRASLGLKGKLINYNNDVSSYEEIVIGSPIWNDRFPPVTTAILAQTDLKDKKLTFVLYSGSGEGKHALKKIQKNYPHAQVIFLKEPKKYPDELKKLEPLF